MVCPKCGRRIPKKSTFCLHCGSRVSASSSETNTTSERRYCILCGCQLPETGVSDVCDSCLAGETPNHATLLVPELPDIPAEAPRKARGATALHMILIALAALLVLAGLFFVPRLLDGSISIDTKRSITEKEQLAASYAQEMVKKVAFDPSSVHFEQLTLSVKVSTDIYTVTQSFERRVSDGSTAKSEYRALLTLKEPDGYTPVKLEVDGETIFVGAFG